MHMLRNYVGEVDFKKGIRAYYAKFFNANATTDDFRIAMEEASGKDLKIFFQQWLYQPVNLQTTWHWFYDTQRKTLEITVNQTQPSSIVFEVPVEFGYYEQGSSDLKIVKFDLKRAQQTESFKLGVVPDKLVFDPRNVLLSYSTLAVQK